ncbi:ATP-binding protein [Flavitalea flava]
MRLNVKPGVVIHRKITWLLLFSVVSLAIVSWLIYINKKNIEKTNLRISQAYEIIGTIHQVIGSVSESGADSYLYLERGDQEAALRIRTFHGKLEQDLDYLHQLTRNNDDQGRNISLLRKYFLEKQAFDESLFLTSQGQSVESNQTGKTDQSSTSERITREHRAADLNNRIKTLLNEMVSEEKKLLTERKNINEVADRRTAYGLIMIRIVSFLFVVIVLIQLNKEFSRRKEAETGLLLSIREAQDAKQMQEQFLANMSHEIRTPMNGIKGMTDLLLGTQLSPKQHELAGIIKSSANNLLVIINDILDFSKIKAGKLNIEKIDFSIKDVLANACAIFDHRLKKKGLLVQVNIDPGMPDFVNGDPHRLNQVLINLLGNAIKFTDKGRILIMVTVQQRSDAGVSLSFSITDTGIGISEDNLPYIFDSFSQAGLDISRRYGGTGLGLTICKQLLKLQGGDITATSEVGKGSAFTFYLPYGYSSSTELKSTPVVLIQDYSNLLVGKRFLVAEDNEINQKLIDYVLRKAGGTVELVNNGAEAISFLQQDQIFDLIIMDLQMPEMDGYQATQFIRNDLHLQTPIIAMTATALKGEQLQCLESGMNEYMTKPFEFADLYKRINSLLS